VALAELEEKLGERFYLCTQNVDDLHERGGSKRVHHMHGTLFQSRCVRCEKPFPDKAFYETAESLPKCVQCGESVRPHIVWFGEMPMDMESIYREIERATVLVVVGSSGSVYPAAAFVNIAKKQGATTIYVGPDAPLNLDLFDEFEEGTATQVLPVLFKK
jgi:NAD-dependent deacetylase